MSPSDLMRRSISFRPAVDRAVRECQAQMMLERNEDVSFNEAVDWLLTWGFISDKYKLGHYAPEEEKGKVATALIELMPRGDESILLRRAGLE